MWNFRSSVNLGLGVSHLGLKVLNIGFRLESKTNKSIMIKLYYESFIVHGVEGLGVKIQDLWFRV